MLVGFLWRFNVSVASSVCCGVSLFVIAGGVGLLWRFLVCCSIARFAVVFFGLLSRCSVCCSVFRFAFTVVFSLRRFAVFAIILPLRSFHINVNSISVDFNLIFG